MITPDYGNSKYDGTFAFQDSSPNVGTAGGYARFVVLSANLQSVKTAGWKTLSKEERRRVMNPFQYTYDTVTYLPGFMSGRRVVSDGVITYSYQGISSFIGSTGFGPDHRFPPSRAKPNDEVVSLALSKLQDRVSQAKVNLAQAFAERKQAATMIEKRAWQIANLLLCLKRGNWGGANQVVREATGILTHPRMPKMSPRQASRGIANLWLEYSYGWKPLLSDIYGSVESIADTYELRRPTVVSARATKDYDIKDEPGFTWYLNGIEATGQQYWNGKISDECRFVIQFAEDDDVCTAMARHGLTNPALLAWELLPYSFVVDWFVPVGNYLQQLEYARGLKFVRGTKTVKRYSLVSGRGVLEKAGNPPGSTVSSFSHLCLFEARSKTRTLLADWPYASFPTFQPNLGIEKTLSAISLVTQALTGGNVRRHSL